MLEYDIIFRMFTAVSLGILIGVDVVAINSLFRPLAKWIDNQHKHQIDHKQVYPTKISL